MQKGKPARDKITGFEGIIIGKCKYLTGCDQYGLTPKAVDNKTGDTQWFDVKRIEILSDSVITTEDVADETDPGGPNRDCPI